MIQAFHAVVARKRVVSAPGGSSPVSGMSLWLKADALSLVDNDPVATWPDSSGNGNDATQATSGKWPVFKDVVRNGKPVVRFDGVNAELALPLNIQSANTVFAVAKMAGSTGQQIIVSATANAGLLALYMQGRANSPNWGTYRNAYFPASAEISSAFKCIAIVTRSGTDFDLVTNGVVETQSGGGYFTNEVARQHVGAGASGENNFQGDIAEILIYPTALSDADRVTNEVYLASKYAL